MKTLDAFVSCLTVRISGAVLLAILALGGATRAQAFESDETAAAKLTRKLQAIVIPRLDFRDATVAEAVEFLKKKSAELDTAEPDPAKRGVNFVLNLGAAPEAAPQRLTLSLSNIPLLEALKYVTGLASLKFKVERSAVVIVPVGAKTKPAAAPLVQGAPDARTRILQEKVTHKLNAIIIPRLEFRDATLREAIDFLKKKTADLDTAEPEPARRGVSVVLRLPATAGATAEPGVENPPGQPVEKRITLSLKNVSLMEAFKYTAALAGCQVRIEPYALTIIPLEEKSNSDAQSPLYLFGVTAMLSIHPRCSCGVRL